MNPLRIPAPGTINRGALKGVTGKVVAYESTDDEALIEMDEYTLVLVKADMIDQEEE